MPVVVNERVRPSSRLMDVGVSIVAEVGPRPQRLLQLLNLKREAKLVGNVRVTREDDEVCRRAMMKPVRGDLHEPACFEYYYAQTRPGTA